jgi:hypothetical protein
MSPKNKRNNSRSNSNNNTRGRSEPHQTRSVKAINKRKNLTVISEAYDNYKPPKNLRPDQQETEIEEVTMEDDVAESSSKNNKETSSETSQQDAAAKDRQDEPIITEISKPVDNDDQDYQKVDRNRGFRAGAPAEKIKGKSHSDKLQIVARHFLKHKGYAGKQMLTIKSVRYAVVYFDTASDLADAIKNDLPISEKETLSFVPYDDIVKRPLPDAVELLNQKTIQVIDIPLNTKAPLVRAAFERYGKISKLNMRTKFNSMFQQAYITFEDISAMEYFKDEWFTFIEKDGVRIFPLTLTEQERNQRRNHVFKLSGFRAGTLARDLVQILETVKAASIFIPRHPGTYKTLNYGFVAFRSDADQNSAAQQNFAFEDCNLFWGPEDMKTCHFCGHPGHIVKNCDSLKNRRRSPREKKIQKLYDRYRPAQHKNRSRPTSYADATKRNIRQTKQREQHPDHAKVDQQIAQFRKDIDDLKTTVFDLSKQLLQFVDEVKAKPNTSGEKPKSNPKDSDKPPTKKTKTADDKPPKRSARTAELTSGSSSTSDNDTSSLEQKLDSMTSVLEKVTGTLNSFDSRLNNMQEIQKTYGTADSNVNLEDDEDVMSEEDEEY